MTIHREFIAALALWLVLAGPVRAEDYGLGDAKATPASVHFAQAGGHWEQGDREGFYRVVVTAGGVEHVAHRLYVQWIAIDQNTQGYRLVRTLDVKELNAGHPSVFSAVPRFADSGNLTIAVSVSRRDGRREKHTIAVRPAGSYSYR